MVSAGASSADPALKAALGKVASELRSRLKSGNSSESTRDFFAASLGALAKVKGSANAQVRLQAFLDCYVYFFMNASSALAMTAAESMRDLAHHVGDSYFLTKAHSSLGIVHAEEHRIADAVLAYTDCIEVASKAGEEEGLVGAWINLGTALNYGSLYRDAIPCFLKSVSLAQRRNAPRLEASALCNLAQSYFALENFHQANEAIAKCFEVQLPPASPGDVFNRTVREFTYARVAMEVSDRRAVEMRVAACIEWAKKSGSAKATFLGQLVTGLSEVKFGDVARGLSRLEGALASNTADVGIMRADALEALVRAYDQAGQPDKAMEHLGGLIKLTKHSRQSAFDALSSQAMHPQGQFLDARANELQSLELLEARLRVQLAERQTELMRSEMFERLAIAADLKEELSGRHGYRVGSICHEFALTIGWSDSQALEFERAARLHDIGKSAVPDRILFNTSALEDAQRQFIEAHTKFGAEMLGNGASSGLKIAEAIARHHHEWWNGEGYPSRLAGKRIPVYARIVALADVFDALTHGRPFSPPWPIERALAEIRARRGTQFDPELTDVFLTLMDRLINEHEDLDAFLGRASRHSPFLQAREKIHRMLAEERRQEEVALAPGNATRH